MDACRRHHSCYHCCIDRIRPTALGARPERGDVTIAFFLLYAIAAGLVSVPIVRTRLESWLTQWHRLYPTVPPSAEL